MATERFVNVGDEELENLLENRNSKNTKTSIKASVNIFRQYCSVIGLDFSEIENLSATELCSKLKKFYAGVRNKKGELYSTKSMISLRYGIQKHFLKVRDLDIVNHEHFKQANEVFTAMLVKLKQEGKGVSAHKPPITLEDLRKLYQSFDLESPTDLKNKVFVDYMLYFCNRGRENLRELTKNDFEINGEGDEREVTLRDHATKNHRGDKKDDDESQGGRMTTSTEIWICPVKSFEKYLSLLNPDCDYLWQRPKSIESKFESLWYDNVAVGKNTLGDKMKTISKKYNLGTVYTNHSLRATTITLLDAEGYEARHIMAISGHKSEASIRSYSRTDVSKKRQIAQLIRDKIKGDGDTPMAPAKLRKVNVTEPEVEKPKINSKDTAPIDPTEPELELNSDMDFLELICSQEHLLMETLSQVTTHNDTSVKTVATRQESRVLTERKPNMGNNMVFHNINNLHIHYH